MMPFSWDLLVSPTQSRLRECFLPTCLILMSFNMVYQSVLLRQLKHFQKDIGFCVRSFSWRVEMILMQDSGDVDQSGCKGGAEAVTYVHLPNPPTHPLPSALHCSTVYLSQNVCQIGTKNVCCRVVKKVY